MSSQPPSAPEPASTETPSTEPASTEVGRRPRVIVGLGNPGERYADTRHNVGFWVVAELARRFGVELGGDECRSRTARVSLEDGRSLLLAEPTTFMNRSGFAVRCLLERFELEPSDFLIVYDEVHLPLGTLRMRPKGSPAGHRGLESVLANLGTDRVPRLRLGVGDESGPPEGGDALVEMVLGDFEADQRPAAEAMARRAADACCRWVEDGIGAAMQAFNGPLPDDPRDSTTP